MFNNISPPEIISQLAQNKFEKTCEQHGLDFEDKWVGGYVEYEWKKFPVILEAYNINPHELKVLEFGCNVGASAIIYEHLGAKVIAIDNSEIIIEIAKSNSNRYGVKNIEFYHIEDTRTLPFNDNQFDIINCLSVFEFVKPEHLKNIQSELNRVLKINGKILIGGTSNRLWPREVHTKNILINYLPRFVDIVFKLNFQRGVFPWKIINGFGENFVNMDKLDDGNTYVISRIKMGNSIKKLKILKFLSNLLRVTPGYLTPNIFSCIKKIK